jgi:hypothetical protein
MKNKKPSVFGETKGSSKTDSKQKPTTIQPLRQQRQRTLDFRDITNERPKTVTIIDCFDCKQQSELDGYRFAFVPLCHCCRTERSLQILDQQIERRNKR